MKKNRLYYLIILFVIALTLPLFTACVSDEEFPTPAGAKVSFSVDSIDFDTIITHTESVTEQFSIYNKNSKGITVTSVSLEGPGKDAFLANVDGMAITSGAPINIDCRGKDSLIAFVQFNAQDNDNDDAQLSEAYIVFTLANGVQQRVYLSGYSQDVVVMRGKVISKDTTFSATRPIAIYDSLYVKPGVTLTIAAGNTLLFSPDAYLKVDGTLKAEGSLEKPITFRGNRYDNMFTHQAYDDVYNQWKGITLTSSSYDNYLNHCDIHAGQWGIICDSSDVKRLKMKLENSRVHNVVDHCLDLKNCQTFVGNSQITNAAKNCINILGGDHQFIHCTVGSFSPFTAFRGNALVFRNYIGEATYPITRLDVFNCIVTGYASDEVFAYMAPNSDIPCNYSFRGSLLDTPEITDNPNVTNNVWETKDMEIKQKDNFIDFNLKQLRYAFRLVEDSPARGIADPEITSTYYPLDKTGRDRLADPKPDAGCYQYVEQPVKE